VTLLDLGFRGGGGEKEGDTSENQV
jgi:hypothetical protein